MGRLLLTGTALGLSLSVASLSASAGSVGGPQIQHSRTADASSEHSFLPNTGPEGCNTPDALQEAFAKLPADQWRAADGALSVNVGRKAVWVFADTIKAGGFAHNTAVVQDGCDFDVVNGGAQIIPNQGRSYLWPYAAVKYGGKILVSAGVITSTGNKPGDFSEHGTEAFFLNTDGTFSSRDRNWPKRSNIDWGAGMFVTKHGKLIVYGSEDVHRPYVFGRSLREATFSNGRWHFDRTPVIPTGEGTDTTVSVSYSGGEYHLLTKPQGALGNTLVSYDSPSPRGPFTEETLVTDLGMKGDHITYSAEAHDLGGNWVISICQNWLDSARHRIGSYRPKFLEYFRPKRTSVS